VVSSVPIHVGLLDAVPGSNVAAITAPSILPAAGRAELLGLLSVLGGGIAVMRKTFLINNARGVGFGLGTRGGQRIYPGNPLSGAGLSAADVQHIGGVIRNNFVFASIPYFDTGIGLEQAWNVGVYHNTV
jgi:hypothetical protein